jgi:NAD(P)-dependent dehydrogenase (short-subunit alcohol dehydrogenase family)
MTQARQSAVIVTGCAGAIGRAICHAFRKVGDYVVGTDLPAADFEDVDAFVPADLADVARDETVRVEFLRHLRAAIADRPLRVLVNNAAIQELHTTADFPADSWMRTLDVNLSAAFFLIQGLLGALANAKGSVINIASVHAQATKPRFVAYATSKAALIGLTRALAVDIGARVRVNAICPAAIDTPMLQAGFEGTETGLDRLNSFHPVGRIGTPEDVAAACLFLTDEESGFLNGAALNLDGGILGRLHDPT